jgi:hypothetical protein
MKERYTDQELIDRGLLELSPEGHLQTPMPAYNTGKKMNEQPLELVTGSDFDLPSDLMRIEDKLDEVLALLTKPKRSTARKTHEYSVDFELIWEGYPDRAGTNSKQKAYTAFRMRQLEGVGITEMQAGTGRYFMYCRATGKLKTEYVMAASRFFGSGREFENEWIIPKKDTMPKSDKEWEDAGIAVGTFARPGESMTALKRRIEVALRD